MRACKVQLIMTPGAAFDHLDGLSHYVEHLLFEYLCSLIDSSRIVALPHARTHLDFIELSLTVGEDDTPVAEELLSRVVCGDVPISPGTRSAEVIAINNERAEQLALAVLTPVFDAALSDSKIWCDDWTSPMGAQPSIACLAASDHLHQTVAQTLSTRGAALRTTHYVRGLVSRRRLRRLRTMAELVPPGNGQWSTCVAMPSLTQSVITVPVASAAQADGLAHALRVAKTCVESQPDPQGFAARVVKRYWRPSALQIHSASGSSVLSALADELVSRLPVQSVLLARVDDPLGVLCTEL